MKRRYRIKKGVRPYGGRTFPGTEPEELPNGRKVVTVYVDTVAGNKNRGLGGDPREYNLDEVEDVGPHEARGGYDPAGSAEVG